jgi:hypothetical protein
MFKGTEWHTQQLAKWYAHLATQQGWSEYVKARLMELEPEWEGLTELARQEWKKLRGANE